MQVSIIGHSYENRDILLYTWFNDPTFDNIVINCGVHAREWIAHSSCQYFLESFLKTEEFRNLRENVNLYLLPIQNHGLHSVSILQNLFLT